MPNYSIMLTELQEEFKRSMAEREQLDRRIAGIMKAMDAVKVLAEDTTEIIPPPPLADEAGFTDKVRNLLRANPARYFTAVEVRDVFLEFDPKADPKIMLIHTHNTLKRLLKQDEVEEVSGDGRTAYRFKPSQRPTYADVMKSLTDMKERADAVMRQTMERKKK